MQTPQQKLEKCAATIAAHVARGGTRYSSRGCELELRYADLRFDAIEQGVWQDYCAANALRVSHTGFDLFTQHNCQTN